MLRSHNIIAHIASLIISEHMGAAFIIIHDILSHLHTLHICRRCGGSTRWCRVSTRPRRSSSPSASTRCSFWPTTRSISTSTGGRRRTTASSTTESPQRFRCCRRVFLLHFTQYGLLGLSGTQYLRRDKMNCAVRFGNCFLRVPLIYQPCCHVPGCQGKPGEPCKKTVFKTYSTVHFVY